jgi:hypothetical protein
LVAPKSKRQMLRGRGNCLVRRHHDIVLLCTNLGEAKPVEFVRVRVYILIRVKRTFRDRHERSRWDSHPVGEGERAKGEAKYAHFKSRGSATETMRIGADEQIP